MCIYTMYNLNLPSKCMGIYEDGNDAGADYCVFLFAFPRISLFVTSRHRHQR
jgi:hypothetical protein